MHDIDSVDAVYEQALPVLSKCNQGQVSWRPTTVK